LSDRACHVHLLVIPKHTAWTRLSLRMKKPELPRAGSLSSQPCFSLLKALGQCPKAKVRNPSEDESLTLLFVHDNDSHTEDLPSSQGQTHWATFALYSRMQRTLAAHPSTSHPQSDRLKPACLGGPHWLPSCLGSGRQGKAELAGLPKTSTSLWSVHLPQNPRQLSPSLLTIRIGLWI
jgi:hypothetical protein